MGLSRRRYWCSVLAACWVAPLSGCRGPQVETENAPPPPVPAFPGSRFVAERTYAEGTWKEYECPASPEEVAGWYAQGQGGWEAESQREEGDTVVYRMKAGKALAEVLVEPSQEEGVATFISTRIIPPAEAERERR